MSVKMYVENNRQLYEVYVNGHDARGARWQRRKAGIETKQKALKLEFEFKRELAQAKDQEVSIRWEEWFETAMKRMRLELLPSTIACYETQLKKWIDPHLKGVEIGSITRADVHDLIYTKCQGFKTQCTRRNVLRMLKRVFEMAVEDGVLEKNPCTGVNVRVLESEQMVLTNSEVELFLREAQRAHHRFYPIWAMALMTGMRSGELYALKWSDCDLDARTISVNKSWCSKIGITPTKTKRSRVVPMADDLVHFLKERRLAHPEDDFVLPRLRDWTKGDQARVTRTFCVGLGITSVKFHDLRATFITNLLARGESLARVMSIVGHAELKTTNGYLRKAGVDVQGGTDKLGYGLPQADRGKVFSIVGQCQ